MPHQCVKCGKVYAEGSREILHGCECKGKLFFYIKKEKLATSEAPFILTSSEKEQIEQDVYDIMGNDIDREMPIILDIESINILRPGKYELDLVNLFKKKHPLVYRVREGKYYIDIRETFLKLSEGKLQKKDDKVKPKPKKKKKEKEEDQF
ncbi:MAG: Zn-ribbon containing protein [Nanoarchaeota archaeon]